MLSIKVNVGFTYEVHEGVTVESKYVSGVEKNLQEESKLAALLRRTKKCIFTKKD
jgi:hypothetical protein